MAAIDPLLLPILEQLLPGGAWEWLTGGPLVEQILRENAGIHLLRVPGGTDPVAQGVAVQLRFLHEGDHDAESFVMTEADYQRQKKRLDRPLEDALYPALWVMVNARDHTDPIPRWVGLTLTRDLVDYFSFGQAGKDWVSDPEADGARERRVYGQTYRDKGKAVLDRDPFMRVWLP